MQTQKVVDNYALDEEDERGPPVANLTLPDRNIVHHLYRGYNQIGRGSQNDVVLDNVTVSDVHAEIDISENNEGFIKDLRSSNGTYVETNHQSNDYIQLRRGQTLLLRNGATLRFGLLRLIYNVMHSNEIGEYHYDVESDSENFQEKNVTLNLNLKGVMNSSVSIFDEPTQPPPRDLSPLRKLEWHNAPKEGLSIFEQDTQVPDNDNIDHTDETFQQEEIENNIVDDENTAGCFTDVKIRGKDEVYGTEKHIDFSSDRRLFDNENVESPTQIQPEVFDRRTSTTSIESPTQIQSDFSSAPHAGSDTETEGEDDKESANMFIISDDKHIGGTMIEKTPRNSPSKDDSDLTKNSKEREEISDTESEDLMMNSQAEFNSDALMLMLPAELQNGEQVPMSSTHDSVSSQEVANSRERSDIENYKQLESLSRYQDELGVADKRKERVSAGENEVHLAQLNSTRTGKKVHNFSGVVGNMDDQSLKFPDAMHGHACCNRMPEEDNIQAEEKTVDINVEKDEISFTAVSSGKISSLVTTKSINLQCLKDGEDVECSQLTNSRIGKKRSCDIESNFAQTCAKKGARKAHVEEEIGSDNMAVISKHLPKRNSRRNVAPLVDCNKKRKVVMDKNIAHSTDDDKMILVDNRSGTCTAKTECRSSTRQRSAKRLEAKLEECNKEIGDGKKSIKKQNRINREDRGGNQDNKHREYEGSADEAIASSPKILFTGLEADDKLRRLVTRIGGNIVDLADMSGVTHVITDGSLKRTPKLLVALNFGACYVVGVEWLEDSAKQNPPAPLPITLAQIPLEPIRKKSRCGRGSDRSISYLVHDNEKERKWAPFTLLKTLVHNFRRISSQEGDPVFTNLAIFVSSDVFGRNAPSREEMKLIVESGGGIFLTNAGDIAKLEKRRLAQHGVSGGIVIVPRDVKKLPSKAIVSFAKAFTGHGSQGLYTVEFLFSAIMRQEIDFKIGVVPHLAV